MTKALRFRMFQWNWWAGKTSVSLIAFEFKFPADKQILCTFQENEMINVISQINEEWLYGSNEAGDCGQFPANFLEFIPSNLPQK